MPFVWETFLVKSWRDKMERRLINKVPNAISWLWDRFEWGNKYLDKVYLFLFQIANFDFNIIIIWYNISPPNIHSLYKVYFWFTFDPQQLQFQGHLGWCNG